jgi:hypothetical protein
MDAGGADKRPPERDSSGHRTGAQSRDWIERSLIMFSADRQPSYQPTQAITLEGGSVEGLHDAEPVDLFDAWLFAEAECALTLQAWSAAGVDEKAASHAAYSAALDREEHAATILRDRLRSAPRPRIGDLMRAA